MRNTFGHLFTLTTFGESHGVAVGGVIDGFPAGIDIDMEFVQNELNRRRPGQSHITTSRNEADKVEFLSGVFEGKSTGTPIGFEVRRFLLCCDVWAYSSESVLPSFFRSSR
jgi:chorismate synthase